VVEGTKALVTTHEIPALEVEVRQSLLKLTPYTTSNIRSLRRKFSKRIADFTPAAVIELALNLLDQGIPRFFTYELIQFHRPAAKSLNAQKLKKLGAGIKSWVDVDTFACYLSGPAWRERQISTSEIERWANSKDRWWRRAAVVSTVPLNNKARGGRGDVERTLHICRMVVQDRDDMVVKALSWALRELAKRDPSVVESFVRTHADELAPRVIREVRNKLRTGLKNPKKEGR